MHVVARPKLSIVRRYAAQCEPGDILVLPGSHEPRARFIRKLSPLKNRWKIDFDNGYYTVVSDAEELTIIRAD